MTPTYFSGFLIVGFVLPVPSIITQLLALFIIWILTGIFDLIIYASTSYHVKVPSKLTESYNIVMDVTGSVSVIFNFLHICNLQIMES
jgi:hypothetical protein